MKKRICPKCNGIIICDDVWDSDIPCEGDIVVETSCIGHCTRCERTWEWKERFVFTEAFDFEEYKDGDY